MLKVFTELLPDVLHDGSRSIAQAIAQLSRKGKNIDVVVDMLLARLKSTDEMAQFGAINALASIGRPAAKAIPALTKIAEKKGKLSSDARYALWRIKPSE